MLRCRVSRRFSSSSRSLCLSSCSPSPRASQLRFPKSDICKPDGPCQGTSWSLGRAAATTCGGRSLCFCTGLAKALFRVLYLLLEDGNRGVCANRGVGRVPERRRTAEGRPTERCTFERHSVRCNGSRAPTIDGEGEEGSLECAADNPCAHDRRTRIAGSSALDCEHTVISGGPVYFRVVWEILHSDVTGNPFGGRLTTGECQVRNCSCNCCACVTCGFGFRFRERVATDDVFEAACQRRVRCCAFDDRPRFVHLSCRARGRSAFTENRRRSRAGSDERHRGHDCDRSQAKHLNESHFGSPFPAASPPSSYGSRRRTSGTTALLHPRRDRGSAKPAPSSKGYPEGPLCWAQTGYSFANPGVPCPGNPSHPPGSHMPSTRFHNIHRRSSQVFFNLLSLR